MNLKKMKANELKGRKIRLLDAISNRAGSVIPKGAVCEIIAAHHGLNIRFACEHCGVKVEVSQIPRDAKYIELVEENAQEKAKGE